jgi:uncharacterized metal-binding protein
MLAAYISITLLTVILVVHNVRIAVSEYHKHRYWLRLSSQMVTLLIVGVMLITVSYLVLDRALDAEASLRDENVQHRVPQGVTKQ